MITVRRVREWLDTFFPFISLRGDQQNKNFMKNSLFEAQTKSTSAYAKPPSHAVKTPLHRIRKQPHSTTKLRYLHRQIHNPHPPQLRIPRIAIANDPRIPLRRTRRALQLPAHGIEPSGALLLRAQRDGLLPRRIPLVGAHVHVEREVAKTERDAAGFDGGVVGVCFFGAGDEGDVVAAGDVGGCVGYCLCWISRVYGRFLMRGCLCVRKRSLNSGDWPWPCLRSLRKMTCWPFSCLLGWNGVDATAVINMLRSASGRMVIISSGVGCV